MFFFTSSIKNACNYDVIGKNVPKKKVSLIWTPAVLLLGDSDDMVDREDFLKMFMLWNGDLKKFRIMQETDHS